MLEREIERRKRRAAALGVDALVKGLYFDHGLRYYVSWSRNSEYVLPSIVDAAQPSSDQVEFSLGAHRYSFHATSKRYEFDSNEYEELELRRDGEIVFGQTLRVEWHYNHDSHTPLSVTGFVEGPWIDELRGLERAFVELENARRTRQHQVQIKQEAARFGLAEGTPRGPSEGWLGRLVKGLFKG